MDNEQSFGKFLRNIRIKAKLSQRDLASKIGVDFTYLSKIENDRMAPPSEETIIKIAEILEEDPDKLIIMANKIPSDYKEIVKNVSPMLLRKISHLPLEKIKKLEEEVNRLSDEK